MAFGESALVLPLAVKGWVKCATLPSSVKSLAACHLYGIVDLGYVEEANVLAMTRALVEGGIDVLQLRAKKLPVERIEALARAMHPITRDREVPLIINDHARIAEVVGAEGVHIGQDDGSVAAARAVVGPACIVGKSTHSLGQALAAEREGADYIGFGPLFATGTKPDYRPIGLMHIAEAHRQVRVPIFCIGGINHERLGEITAAGAVRVAVVSDLLLAADVRKHVAALKAQLAATTRREP